MQASSQNFAIPLHKPFWGKEEEKAAVAAMRGGTGIGDLVYSEKLARELADYLAVKYVLPTGSGTAALELACACLFKRDDEVILPSFTFASCANAIMLSGAKPVFCDIDIKAYNINPAEIERKISTKTKGIMVVHYAGFACDMEKIMDLGRRYNLEVIEDAAHALGAKYKQSLRSSSASWRIAGLKGLALGTIGKIGCFSFHGTKNVASGEGGAFVTDDDKIFKIAEIIREKGTDRSSFMRGERKKYSWVKVGRSLILSDILAAIALVQVKKIEIITTLRRKNATYLLSKLEKLASKIILPTESDYAFGNWHIFAIRVPTAIRDKVIKGLRSYGIEAAFHFLPLHTSVMGRKLGYRVGDLPVTEEIAATLIRLPMYPNLKKSEMDFMAAALEKVL